METNSIANMSRFFCFLAVVAVAALPCLVSGAAGPCASELRVCQAEAFQKFKANKAGAEGSNVRMQVIQMNPNFK